MDIKLRPEIKARWLAALRSGEYKPGRRRLVTVNMATGERQYCCLGVLTDLAVKDGVTHWLETQNVGDGIGRPAVPDSKFTNQGAVLSYAVVRWAFVNGPSIANAMLTDDLLEVAAVNPKISAGVLTRLGEWMNHTHGAQLSTVNDLGKSFEYIAQCIEAEL